MKWWRMPGASLSAFNGVSCGSSPSGAPVSRPLIVGRHELDVAVLLRGDVGDEVRTTGYLFVRGGVHALAYAKALEELTGVDVKKMLPIPNLPDADFKELVRHRAGERSAPGAE